MRNSLIVCCLVCATVLYVSAGCPASAQEDAESWVLSEKITETRGSLASSGMALLADPAGRLHLFYPHQAADTTVTSVDYAQWDGSGWSQPVDILIDPGGGDLHNVRATIDAQQVVHLAWVGANRRLWHASAPLEQAGSPQAWSEPQWIGNSMTDADLIAGPEGRLYAAYGDGESGTEIQLVRSTDWGETWSRPLRITGVSGTESAPDDVRLGLDGAGRLHVVWTEYRLPDGWPPTGAFYVRSLDDGQTWEQPLWLAGEGHGEAGVGTVGDDGVHVVWRSTIGGDGTFHQWSTDGGTTWSTPDRFDDRGGFAGLPSFAVDTLGRVHFGIGGGAYGNSLGEYYSLRSEALSALAENRIGRGVLAITSGNQLHVVIAADNSLWHLTKGLDIPPLPAPSPAPTAAAPSPTAPMSPTATVPPAHPTTQQRVTAVEPPGDISSPSSTMEIARGVVPAALVVGVVVLSVLAVRGRR